MFYHMIFYWSFMALQNYFSQIEPNQSLDGEKTGDSHEKPPDNPRAELGLSRV